MMKYYKDNANNFYGVATQPNEDENLELINCLVENGVTIVGLDDSALDMSGYTSLTDAIATLSDNEKIELIKKFVQCDFTLDGAMEYYSTVQEFIEDNAVSFKTEGVAKYLSKAVENFQYASTPGVSQGDYTFAYAYNLGFKLDSDTLYNALFEVYHTVYEVNPKDVNDAESIDLIKGYTENFDSYMEKQFTATPATVTTSLA
ncbi:hypothetical protein GPK34_00405 [Secundilactobacillus kimchicus]|uniref:hypothetical protein n=1 Tax=Secundilactobacillus kimchicus TaxID=528209 RepID=UPI001C037009|nr:hypothetical protein [Secundilactobacillus kimchicus]MBT9670498.1 hypothetical protein [Secundilactobacillus kimchicus]